MEYTETRSERRARISVLTVANAFEADDPWDGVSTYDPGTGCIRLGRYVDGEPSHWMLHKPGSGAASGVIAGVQGSGKTGSTHVLACEAGLAKTGGQRICAVWVGDPQEQPLGVWRGRANLTGWGELGCVHMLLMLYFGMRARAARFGVMEWTDHLGRLNTGKGWFDPLPGEAEIAAFIDEWPRLANHPVFGPLVIALAAAILKEGRKVGIALYLMTQLPDLSELGERAIRELLKAFNALAHRTDGLSKTMLGIQGDPTKLPPGVHGVGYLNGPDQRPAATQRPSTCPSTSSPVTRPAPTSAVSPSRSPMTRWNSAPRSPMPSPASATPAAARSSTAPSGTRTLPCWRGSWSSKPSPTPSSPRPARRRFSVPRRLPPPPPPR